MFVLVAPAQVVGLLVSGQLLLAGGLLLEHPWLSVLISAGSGLAAGLALGFFSRPAPGHLGAYLTAGAAFGLGSVAFLALLAALRLPSGAALPGWYLFAGGAVVTVAVQTLVSGQLWHRAGAD